MKKLITILLVLLISLSFVGCKKNKHDCTKEGHDFGLWIVEKEATCTEDGVRHCTCKYCGYYLENVISAFEHNSSNWVIAAEPTCTQEGLTQLICNYCGEILQEKTMDKIEHNFRNDVCTMCGYRKEKKNDIRYEDFIVVDGVLVNYVGSESEVIIPETMQDGTCIIEIGEEAFKNCTTITNLVMPDTVTLLGECAFSGCSNMKEITLSNTLEKIAAGCFNGCKSLLHLTIPASVKEIESDTEIYGCALGELGGLQTIVVEEGNPVYDSRNNCNAIIQTDNNTLIRGCINTAIPNSVVTLGPQSFGSTIDLVGIVLPASLKYIDYLAFMDCENLNTILIPEGVVNVDNYAFEGCDNLKNISIHKNLNSYDFLMYISKQCKVIFTGTKAEFEENVMNRVELIDSYLTIVCDDETFDFIPEVEPGGMEDPLEGIEE